MCGVYPHAHTCIEKPFEFVIWNVSSMQKQKQTEPLAPWNDRSEQRSEMDWSLLVETQKFDMAVLGLAACHGRKLENRRYAWLIGPCITRESRVSSLVVDSGPCYHPLLEVTRRKPENCKRWKSEVQVGYKFYIYWDVSHTHAERSGREPTKAQNETCLPCVWNKCIYPKVLIKIMNFVFWDHHIVLNRSLMVHVFCGRTVKVHFHCANSFSMVWTCVAILINLDTHQWCNDTTCKQDCLCMCSSDANCELVRWLQIWSLASFDADWYSDVLEWVPEQDKGDKAIVVCNTGRYSKNNRNKT